VQIQGANSANQAIAKSKLKNTSAAEQNVAQNAKGNKNNRFKNKP
jgi:hypothetical protein